RACAQHRTADGKRLYRKLAGGPRTDGEKLRRKHEFGQKLNYRPSSIISKLSSYCCTRGLVDNSSYRPLSARIGRHTVSGLLNPVGRDEIPCARTLFIQVLRNSGPS